MGSDLPDHPLDLTIPCMGREADTVRCHDHKAGPTIFRERKDLTLLVIFFQPIEDHLGLGLGDVRGQQDDHRGPADVLDHCVHSAVPPATREAEGEARNDDPNTAGTTDAEADDLAGRVVPGQPCCFLGAYVGGYDRVLPGQTLLDLLGFLRADARGQPCEDLVGRCSSIEVSLGLILLEVGGNEPAPGQSRCQRVLLNIGACLSTSDAPAGRDVACCDGTTTLYHNMDNLTIF